jgi:hypothetical protein
MGATEKVLEEQLRQRLARMGYNLVRSRTRDPHSITFDRYMITDANNGRVMAGRGFVLRLEDVAVWIMETSADAA